MAIAFRASASATTQSGATTITIPGTVQAGDALIIAGGMNDAGVSDFDWPTPSGWTRLQHSRAGSDVYGALYGKVATASDAGAQVVLDTDTTGKSGVVLAAYSGTDPVAPFHATAQRVESSSTATHATPTVDVTVEDAQIVIAAIQGNSAVESWGTASGYTKRVDAIDNDHLGGHVTATIQDKAVSEMGTYGGENLVAANPSAKAITWTVALAPVSDTQTSRPVSDIASSGAVGVPEPDPGTGLYARLAANTDNEYVQLSDGGSVQVGMAPLADPLTDDGHVVRYRARYGGGAEGGDVTVTLKEGSTTIATWQESLTDTFDDYSHQLDPEEAAEISDYSDLNLTFEADLS